MSRSNRSRSVLAPMFASPQAVRPRQRAQLPAHRTGGAARPGGVDQLPRHPADRDGPVPRARALIVMVTRRKAIPVNVGGVVIGGAAPIAVQTMTKTDTRDVKAT